MRTHLKPALLVLWTFVVSSTPTELNLYISKDHLTEYYNISIDDKVVVVHKRQNRVSPSHHLTFANGTELPPFPGSVDEVTFTWLATEKEEVTYSIGLQEDLQKPSLLMNPTISISNTGLVPENRSTFDVSLNCASMASGVARIGVNLSLHYHDDNFSLPVFFYIEKDCTAGMDLNDKVQPTETAGENTKTLDLDGSGVLSTDGRMEASLVSLGVMPPTTTVGSQSSHGNVVTSMSSYAVTSTMKSSQSETTVLLPTSTTTKRLSSTPLPQSDTPFTSPVTISTSSRGADITITSVEPSSLLSSLEDIHSTVSSSSSVLQSSTVLYTSLPSSIILSSSVVEQTPSSLLVESSSTVSSTITVDVLSSSLTGSTTSSTTSVFITLSTAAPVSSISVTSSPSVMSQGVNSTLPGSSLPVSSFTSIFSSPPITSSFIITSSSPIVSTQSASIQSSQSDRSTSFEISSTVVPSMTTKSSIVPVPSAAPDSSMIVETSSSSTTSLPVSLTTSNVSLTPSTTSVAVTSTSHVLSSSITSTIVTVVTTSSSTKPTTITVSSQPVTSSTKDTESSTTFITPSSSDSVTSSRATSSVSQADITITDTSSIMALPSSTSVSIKLVSSSSIHSSTSKATTSAVASTSSRSVPPSVKSTSKVHSPSILPSSTKSVPIASTTVESSPTVGAPTANSETDEASLTLIIIIAATTSALITVCVMLICIIMAMMCRRRRKPRRRRSPVDNTIRIEFNSPMHGDKYKEENIGPPSACTSLRWGSIRNLSKPAQKLVEQLAVDRESLEMLDTIKKGEYGWLVKATASTEPDNDADTLPTHQPVLVKMITGLGLGTKACGSCEEVSEFLDQATLLRGISHRNILAVMGLCSDDHQAPIVIYSYPSIGNLHTFLTAHKQATSATRQKGPVTPKLLMDLCVQLAEAMKHLECFRIIHPDLQLRTCYLDEGYTLKLADGALMSDFYPECYHVVYGAQRPVRWSALETLQGGLCTLQSNVWSFGITIWEIITMGDFPYSEVTNRNVLAHVMLGSRLEQPHDCPNELYETMCNCWHTIPRQRPMFIQISSDLKNVARLYNTNEEIGAPNSDNSDSAFFFKQQQQQLSSSPQAFHYNDKDMSYLLSAPITEADGVSITFSALGSTEDLTQAGTNCMEGDNKHEDVRSSVDVTTETSSSICSPEEQLSPIPHINIAPPDIPYTNDQQQSVTPNRVPLRNEPPVNKFLLKANGSRESTPDYRYSMSSDSQYSSSQLSSDASDNNRQHLIRHKRDSPEKRTTAIAEQSHKEEKESSTDSGIPSMEGGMLSELMVSFDQRLSNSSHQ